MQQFSTKYTYIFTLGLCLACSVLLASAAVMLRANQEENQRLDKQKSVLQAANLVAPGEKLTPARVEEKFSTITPRIIDLTSDTYAQGVTAAEFDAEEVPVVAAPDNAAQVKEIPEQVQVFEVMKGDSLDMLVLPIEGKGLWGTLYGYLALDSDLRTIKGITYYDHKETPGLGGEVDNPKWKNRWPGRKAFDEEWDVAIHVVKGAAGPVAEDPYSVDGLSGATITSRSVTHMLEFWLGEEGFGPWLEGLREGRSS